MIRLPIGQTAGDNENRPALPESFCEPNISAGCRDLRCLQALRPSEQAWHLRCFATGIQVLTAWQTVTRNVKLPDKMRSSNIQDDTSMNDQIRKAIRQRARRAVSKDDLVRAVFDSFRSQQIELRNVTLEDMKAALVEAARAAREEKHVAA